MFRARNILWGRRTGVMTAKYSHSGTFCRTTDGCEGRFIQVLLVLSSTAECCFHKAEVEGSNPPEPTKCFPWKHFEEDEGRVLWTRKEYSEKIKRSVSTKAVSPSV